MVKINGKIINPGNYTRYLCKIKIDNKKIKFLRD